MISRNAGCNLAGQRSVLFIGIRIAIGVFLELRILYAIDLGYWISIVSRASFQFPSPLSISLLMTFLAFSNYDFKSTIYILFADSSSMVAIFSLTVSCMSNSDYCLIYTSFSCRSVSIARIDVVHRLPSFKPLISKSNSSSRSYPNTVSGDESFYDDCSLRFIVSFLGLFCVIIVYNELIAESISPRFPPI